MHCATASLESSSLTYWLFYCSCGPPADAVTFHHSCVSSVHTHSPLLGELCTLVLHRIAHRHLKMVCEAVQSPQSDPVWVNMPVDVWISLKDIRVGWDRLLTGPLILLQKSCVCVGMAEWHRVRDYNAQLSPGKKSHDVPNIYLMLSDLKCSHWLNYSLNFQGGERRNVQ